LGKVTAFLQVVNPKMKLVRSNPAILPAAKNEFRPGHVKFASFICGKIAYHNGCKESPSKPEPDKARAWKAPVSDYGA
jgi:hypothetical protein